MISVDADYIGRVKLRFKQYIKSYKYHGWLIFCMGITMPKPAGFILLGMCLIEGIIYFSIRKSLDHVQSAWFFLK